MTDLVNYLSIEGEIAIIPTDTVYGVVARATDPKAVARLIINGTIEVLRPVAVVFNRS